MASLTTTEGRGTDGQAVFLLTQIEPEPLVVRLLRQLRSAASDLARDPREFVRASFTDVNQDHARRQILYRGFALGVVIYGLLLTLVLVVGLRKILNVNTAPQDDVVMLPAGPRLPEEPGGGEKLDAKKGNGGGGSGQNDARPVSKGVLPEPAAHPPIVRPNPSNIPAPSLPMSPTVVGSVSASQAVTAPIGFPSGNPGDFAPGPGEGGNIGTGKGTGAGSGTGGGAGSGSGGNKGGGEAGLPNGSGSRLLTDYDWAQIRSKPGVAGITWIRRLRAAVSPEAQKSVAQEGQVWLRATFRADGTITDIEVINGIDFMTEAAIDALKHSTFHPALFNGNPITVTNVVVSVAVGPRPVYRPSR